MKSAKKKLYNSNNQGTLSSTGKQNLNLNNNNNEDPSKQLNERDILKKMMNFYQDDFLHQFNVKGNHLN